MPEQNPENNVQAQPSSLDFKSSTGNTKYTDNTDALKKKIDSTSVTKQEKCPKGSDPVHKSKTTGIKIGRAHV